MWSYIEYALQRAFSKFTSGDPDNLAAAAAYYAVIGAKARIDMVAGAARLRLSHVDFGIFQKLLKRAAMLSQKRNDFAHNFVDFRAGAYPDGYPIHSVPFFRNPNYIAIYSGNAKKPRIYNIDDIKKAADSFEKLGEDIYNFVHNVSLVRTRRPATIPRVIPR